MWFPKNKQTLKLKALTWSIWSKINTKNVSAPKMWMCHKSFKTDMSTFMRDVINSYFILDKKYWRTLQVWHIKQENSIHTGKDNTVVVFVAGEKPLFVKSPWMRGNTHTGCIYWAGCWHIEYYEYKKLFEFHIKVWINFI